MRILLDTHVWLWMLSAPERLGSAASLLEDPENRLTVSAVTSWEIAIKVSIGKLSLPAAPATYLLTQMADYDVDGLAVDHRHALRVADLPPHHRDPFDRLLIAQSLVEGIPIMSADRAFQAYQCEVISVGP